MTKKNLLLERSLLIDIALRSIRDDTHSALYNKYLSKLSLSLDERFTLSKLALIGANVLKKSISNLSDKPFAIVNTDLISLLLHGYIPAISFIAHEYTHGCGTKKSIFIATLLVEIGAQLGDERSVALKRGIDPFLEKSNFLEMNEFISQSMHLFTPQIEETAAKYASIFINNNNNALEVLAEDKVKYNFLAVNAVRPQLLHFTKEGSDLILTPVKWEKYFSKQELTYYCHRTGWFVQLEAKLTVTEMNDTLQYHARQVNFKTLMFQNTQKLLTSYLDEFKSRIAGNKDSIIPPQIPIELLEDAKFIAPNRSAAESKKYYLLQKSLSYTKELLEHECTTDKLHIQRHLKGSEYTERIYPEQDLEYYVKLFDTFLKIIPKNHDMYNASRWHFEVMAEQFKTFLICGNKDTAHYLAYFYTHGFGVKEDIQRAALWTEVGHQLGNQVCTNLRNGVDLLKKLLPEGVPDMGKYISKSKTLDFGLVMEVGYAYALSVKRTISASQSQELSKEKVDELRSSFENAYAPPYLLLKDGDYGCVSIQTRIDYNLLGCIEVSDSICSMM